MLGWLLDYLKCPACTDGSIRLARRDVTHALEAGGRVEEVIVTGVLACAACGARYPVLEESPRLLPGGALTAAERAVLDAAPAPRVLEGPAQQLSPEQVRAQIADRIMDDYHRPASGPSLRRAQADLAYQLAYEENRVYQMKFLRRYLAGPVTLMVDIGGGRGGNLQAARKAFDFRHGIVADLDGKWPPMFRTGDRSLVYIRADATRLPLRSRCADLAISSFLLEHVKDWQSLVREIRRLAPVAFLAFGPNRAFPYEVGHVSAPLAHTLPLRLGAMAASTWDRFSGNRRSYARLKEILGDMNYITSGAYYSFCRREGIDVRNVFPEMLLAWAGAGGAGKRAFLARHPRLVHVLGRCLAAPGLEPNIYSIIRQG